MKWNDFSSNVHKSFQKLRKEEDFFDITLVGDDCKEVTAHKLVLSSSSEYFKKIFSNNKKYFQSHALICLEGLNQSDLNNVLDYIYHGEIQIYQHDLDRFLAIAERFKLEGLIGGEQHERNEDTKDESIVKEKALTPIVQQTEIHKSKNVRNREKPVIEVQSSVIQSLEELDQKVEESYSKNSDGLYSCNHCSQTTDRRGNIREHVERHFEGLSFPCTLCNTILRSRIALRFHNKRKHN